MSILENTVSLGSAAYHANRDGMLGLIDRMRALEDRTRAASAVAKDRFHKRGQLLPRERVALVLDPGAPFIELSTLAGYMFDVPDPSKSVPGGGVIAGIGFVSGIRCMVSANDSGIDAGALQPYGLDKTIRVQERVQESRWRTSCLMSSWSKAPVPISCATASKTLSVAATSSAISRGSRLPGCPSSP
ncbi:acetyl-CoA carboxylase carboxyltransferase component [Bradyrhizobium sp. LM3.6]